MAVSVAVSVSVAVAVVASVRNFVAFAIDKDLWNEIESDRFNYNGSGSRAKVNFNGCRGRGGVD